MGLTKKVDCDDETIEYRGYSIVVAHDEFAENPRKVHSQMGTMVFNGNHSHLGDIQLGKRSKEDPYFEDMEDLLNYLNGKPRKYDSPVCESLPIYILSHGGECISTSPFNVSFDSGLIGFIFVDRETVCRTYNVKRVSAKLKKEVKQRLIDEVTELNQWINNDVWYFEVWSSDDTDDAVDEERGYYDRDACIEDAKRSVDNELKEESCPVSE